MSGLTTVRSTEERESSARSRTRLQVAAERKLRGDLKTLTKFIDVYCRHRHKDVPRVPALLKTHDVAALYGKPLRLCASCQKLLAHAVVKRARCPLDPKPDCKQCPTHCYAPKYRARIRQVMKYSGRRLVLSGRLDYLFRLFG